MLRNTVEYYTAGLATGRFVSAPASPGPFWRVNKLPRADPRGVVCVPLPLRVRKSLFIAFARYGQPFTPAAKPAEYSGK